MSQLLRCLAFSLAFALAGPSHAAATQGSPKPSQLIIHGAIDKAALLPLIEAFQQQHPGFSISYQEFESQALYQHFLDHPEKRPDLMLSPAMHLQFKLANDGYAQSYRSEETNRLPERAKWRDELFAYALDPIVLIINTDILAGKPLPHNRDQLQGLIRSKGHLLDEKIGLPDIETSALGYLAWSYDSQLSRTYERRLEAFGSHHSKRYANTHAMLKALARGEIFIAYNALGSYSQALVNTHPWMASVQPTDYTTVLTRTAFIPKTAQHPASAQTFLDFLISSEGQQILAEHASLIPIEASETGTDALEQARSLLKPIPLSLELLLQTDSAKRQLLLEEWHDAMPSLPH